MDIQIPGLLRIKPKALHKIGKYLNQEGFTHIALLFGTGMRDLVGTTLDISLESAQIRVLLDAEIGNNQLEEVFKTTFAIPRGAKAIVAIGGGMVIDYAKYIAFVAHLPVVSIPTSISNDGFASPMASLYVDGRRRSLKAKMPHGVLIDTEVLAKAPPKFTLSGIGDLVSKYGAIRDWKDSFRATGEGVNDFAVMLGLSATDAVLNHPALSPQDPDFIRVLAQALVTSGVTMEIAGSSRPASGGEHLVSHAYDRLAATPSLHGLQVALASLCTLWLQDHPRRMDVQTFLERMGVLAWLRDHPLERPAFLEAVRIAPSIKDGYFTVLSKQENRDRLLDWLGGDPFWADLLV